MFLVIASWVSRQTHFSLKFKQDIALFWVFYERASQGHLKFIAFGYTVLPLKLKFIEYACLCVWQWQNFHF